MCLFRSLIWSLVNTAFICILNHWHVLLDPPIGGNQFSARTTNKVIPWERKSDAAADDDLIANTCTDADTEDSPDADADDDVGLDDSDDDSRR